MRGKNEKMIAANELRIGNWVNNGFKDYQVSVATIWQLGLWYATALPIPLTEEWLLRFGFEVLEFDHKENQYGFKGRLIVIRHGLFCDYGTSVIIKHVHQLQNLYFSLTGEELTIKE